ncbi:MAG: two-component system response regulator CreB [Lentisphaeraceae bacterium]|nr:two-component system response regulator CreB [Lentisphaeraceae bacterium]
MQKILVIEDEPSIADNIVLALNMEGFSTHWCNTLQDAKSWLNVNEADLLVLDIGLPDGNGFDFCRELRQTSTVPVIMLTARSDEIDRIVGLEIGADDYVTKPFSPRELSARVKAVLRRVSPQTKETPRKSADLQIDDEAFTVCWKGESIILSAHEFRLLHALASPSGRTFSRSQLLTKAWDDPGTAMERTVDAHVKSLRAKMKNVIGKDLIVTHRGFGYSLEC